MKSVFIKQIFAINFRNLISLTLDPHPGLNVFLGRNGQGKTNLLEAISLGSSLKSIRFMKNQEMIQFGAAQSHVRTHICGHHNFTVDVTILAQGKKVQMAGKAVRDLTALNSKTAVVSFVPDDLHIVVGSASFRRRLLDQVAVGLFPSYLPIYRRFEKALLQRNHLLKSFNVDVVQLSSFNEICAASAAPLIKMRQRAIDILKLQFSRSLVEISGASISAEIGYFGSGTSKTQDEEEIKDNLLSTMKNLEKEERARKITLCGPHLDDLSITIDGYAARPVASRGQARAIVLALKIAQMETVVQHRQLAPILLLDDVVGELDQHNAQRLLDTIQRVGAQTFITSTHLDVLPANWRHCHPFQIHEGTLINPTVDAHRMHTL